MPKVDLGSTLDLRMYAREQDMKYIQMPRQTQTQEVHAAASALHRDWVDDIHQEENHNKADNATRSEGVHVALGLENHVSKKMPTLFEGAIHNFADKTAHISRQILSEQTPITGTDGMKAHLKYSAAVLKQSGSLADMDLINMYKHEHVHQKFDRIGCFGEIIEVWRWIKCTACHVCFGGPYASFFWRFLRFHEF